MIRLLIALFFGYIVFRCTTVMREVEEHRDALQSGSQAQNGAVVPAPVTARSPRWEKAVYKDALTGKDVVVMSVESSNTHTFEFPYQGGSIATLAVRRHPQHGVDIFVTINKGHLTCEYSNCRVGWRVDELPIRRPEATEPVDGSSNTYFLHDSGRLIKDLKAGRRLVLVTTMYQEGSREWEFNVEGFVAP